MTTKLLMLEGSTETMIIGGQSSAETAIVEGQLTTEATGIELVDTEELKDSSVRPNPKSMIEY